MTSKRRVEEIVNLVEFLCICGFPEEFEIMGRSIVDRLSYVSDFSMDTGKAKEWSGAILYLIAKESGLFKMSEVRINDQMCISEEKMAKLIIRVKCDIMKYNADKIRQALPKNFNFYVKIKDDAAYEVMSNFKTNIESAKDISTMKDVCDYFYDFSLEVLENIKEYIEKEYRRIFIQNIEVKLEEIRYNIKNDTFENLYGNFLDNNETMTYLRLKFEIGVLNYLGRNFEEALEAFKVVLELDKTDMFEARHRILPCLIKLNRLKEAKQFVYKFKNDESTFMLYNKALYYHLCNDEVNANLYIQKAFEKNNIIPKYLLEITDAGGSNSIITDCLRGVKFIYSEGSKEEALVYSNVIDLFWQDTIERRIWLLDKYLFYLKKNHIGITYEKNSIENHIIKSFKICKERMKNKKLQKEEIQIERYLDIMKEEILESYREAGEYIDEDKIMDIRSNKSDDED